MSEEILLKFSEPELLIIVDQLYVNMSLDYRQHLLLDEANRQADIENYKTRQKTRYDILCRICSVLDIAESEFEELTSIKAELEEKE